MAAQQITYTGTEFPLTLSFNTREDGTVVMGSWDREGGGECWTYLTAKPEGLVRDNIRLFQTPEGVRIQTGIVLAQDGTGRAVAWRVTPNEPFEKVWAAEQLVRNEDTGTVYGMTGADKARARRNLPKAKAALYALVNGMNDQELKEYGVYRSAVLREIKEGREAHHAKSA